MAEVSQRLENLRKGRGTKKKLGHKSYSIKLSPQDKQTVEDIAESFECTYGDKGSISCLLSKLASRELMVVSTPPTWQETSSGEKISTIDSEPASVLPNPEKVLQETFPKISSLQQNDVFSSESEQRIAT